MNETYLSSVKSMASISSVCFLSKVLNYMRCSTNKITCRFIYIEYQNYFFCLIYVIIGQKLCLSELSSSFIRKENKQNVNTKMTIPIIRWRHIYYNNSPNFSCLSRTLMVCSHVIITDVRLKSIWIMMLTLQTKINKIKFDKIICEGEHFYLESNYFCLYYSPL